MSEELLRRARRGAAYLDKRLGRGWRRQIRRRRLNMGMGAPGPNGCGCILTQLYGSYERGGDELDLNLDSGAPGRLGFYTAKYDDYEPLTEAWLTVLREKS